MTDRLRIKDPKGFRNARLSVQAVMNCHTTGNFGNCNGGMTEKVAEFLRVHGTVDETCMPYEGVDRSVIAQGDCTDFMFRDCYSDGSCEMIPNPKKYRIRSWGLLSGEDAIMNEIYQRGPVACYVWSHLPQFSEYTGGIINSDIVFTPGKYSRLSFVPLQSYRSLVIHSH
jgi:cathepsin X